MVVGDKQLKKIFQIKKQQCSNNKKIFSYLEKLRTESKTEAFHEKPWQSSKFQQTT